MPEWVREHIGEIALLIYLLYPLLKRWSDRRKERRDRARQSEQTETTEQARTRRQKPQKQEPARTRTEARTQGKTRPKPPARGRPEAPRPPPPERPREKDFLEAARARTARLRQEASRLVARAEADARLSRLLPALREDLLGRVDAVERSLGGTPTLSTVVQDATVIRGLEELLRYLTAMARQRVSGDASFLAEADTMADALYAPILELARVQGLDLKTKEPVAVTGDWDLSVVPRFASTRVAPLRLPAGFAHSLWDWPAIGQEVAHDFFFSLERIERDLYGRLGLPRRVDVPRSETELDTTWLRGLFGAWLPEVFADLTGTLMLGPAYAETMRRAFRNPGSPQRTAAILQDGGVIDEHPPERLRIYMATRVLHHLGRHEEADEIWEQWTNDHPDVSFYYLPLGGDWVGLSEEALHALADSFVDALLTHPWPELDGFQLLNIPGLAYLRAEHSTVERLMEPLARGESIDADPRWVMAAAVLAAKAQPTLHDQILEAARTSIRGVGAEPVRAEAPRSRRQPATSIGGALVASLKRSEAIREAVVLGAALTPYRRRRW